MQPQWKNGKKHQCPPKAYIRAKYRTTLQLLHLQDSSKKNVPPAMSHMGLDQFTMGMDLMSQMGLCELKATLMLQMQLIQMKVAKTFQMELC